MLKGLLELLAEEVNSDYISDLNRDYCKLNKKFIETIPEGRYSLEEWTETLTYILRENVSITSPQEAKSFLIKKISEN